MAKLTDKEKLEIIEQSLIADKEGRSDDATKILMKLPLAPHLAVAAKEICGKDFFIENDFDLSEVEEKYGKNWLYT